jgi:hypothetical protein
MKGDTLDHRITARRHGNGEAAALLLLLQGRSR